MQQFLMSLPLALASACFAVACADRPDVPPADEAAQKALGGHPKVVVYGSEGPLLRAYALDLSNGQLAATSSVPFTLNVQYVAVDRNSRHLYVSTSNGSTSHELHAFDVDPISGALSPRGAPLAPSGGRIIHLSVNHQDSHLALAHNQTGKAAIVALAGDGSLAGEVAQTDATTGPFPHQAKFDHAGHNLIVPGLALNGGDGTLTVFDVGQGLLTKTQTLTFPAGFGARHLDYGHDGRFVYVAMERGNRLYTYRFAGQRLSVTPVFDQSTLADPGHNALPRQRAGAIHVHPNGRFLYLSNRQDTVAGASLPGENNVAVFALDVSTGQPTLLQHIDTRGIEARTFTIDPTGQYLIVGNQVSRTVGTVVVPRSLAVFHIGGDGTLTFLHKYDVASGDVFWVGSIAL